MNFNVGLGVGAVFKLVVRKAETDEIVRETPEFLNLVLTTGLARMAVNTWIDRCCVGTGNSNPVASQVALDSFLASTTATAADDADTGGIQVTTAPYYWYGRRTWRFAVGVATGNISEIGLGWGNTTLWNRALIKDTAGNPTTISVLADEYLDVISEVRVYPHESTGSFNLVDKAGTVISAHTFIAKPILRYNSVYGAYWKPEAVKVGDSFGYTQGIGFSSDAMGNNNNSITIGVELPGLTITAGANSITAKKTVTSSEANIGPHKSFQTYMSGLMCGGGSNQSGMNNVGCCYKWEVNPPIPKDAETILTYSFTLTWGNYAP